MHLDNLRKILANVEVEFGLIYDVTPSFAEAEYMTVRLVTTGF